MQRDKWGNRLVYEAIGGKEGAKRRASAPWYQANQRFCPMASKETKTCVLAWPMFMRDYPMSRVLGISMSVVGSASVIGTEVDLESRCVKVKLHNPTDKVVPCAVVSRWWIRDPPVVDEWAEYLSQFRDGGVTHV
jgi:hypothetical protein